MSRAEELRQVTPAFLEALVSSVTRELQTLGVHARERRRRLGAFKARDHLRGDYWTPGAVSRRWYRHDGSEWTPDRDPPERLEAPTALEDEAVLFVGDDLASAVTPGSRPATTDPVAALAAVIRATNDAYLQGVLASTDAGDLLAEYHLVDRDARFWTLGCRTGQWYAFEAGAWSPQPAPPREEDLLREASPPADCAACGAALPDDGERCPRCAAPVVVAIEGWSERVGEAWPRFLLEGMATLPEPLVDAWDPPEGVPEMPPMPALPCARCGHPNDIDRAFCGECGQSMAQRPATGDARLEERRCDHCDAILRPGLRFCTGCGSELESP